MQLMAHQLGGQVEFSARREYGAAVLHVMDGSKLFEGLGPQLDIWNSHGDKVTALPAGFHAAARTENSPFAAIENSERNLFAVQFHPDVAHTPRGREILQHFLYHICHCTMDWTMGSFIEDACERVRAQVGDNKVVLGLSGGVVCSFIDVLLPKAIWEPLNRIFAIQAS